MSLKSARKIKKIENELFPSKASIHSTSYFEKNNMKLQNLLMNLVIKQDFYFQDLFRIKIEEEFVILTEKLLN